MNLDNLTLGNLKEIQSLIGSQNQSNDHPYDIGQAYFIRTVTHYFTGRLVAVFENELVMDEVAWIADTGRYADFIKSGKPSEVEPVGDHIIIGRKAIIDCTPWALILPKEQI